MYKRILVPLDGSALAEAALAPAMELARCMGAEIVLLRVMITPVYEFIATEPMMTAVRVETREANTQEVQSYLERVATTLGEKGARVRVQACEGPVADAILDYAESIHADLIAMSTHGRSGIARWVMGSVADKVVHAAPVPVLLVRPHPPKSAS